jgi:hypothetical protein
MTAPARRVPLWLKLLPTLFTAVLVPAYWDHYGPSNFLWFSDIALFVTVAALWLENRFLASMQAVAVGAVELVWAVDFLFRLVTGHELLGATRYMFNPDHPLFIRGLSLFHLWLPLLLFWLVWRLGYDRRAWLAQVALAAVILPVCYLFVTWRNINWVYGLGEQRQEWMPPPLYLLLLFAVLTLGVYLPTHLLLRALVPVRPR